ncbi:pseudouridine synthase [uncultured Sunxiuqinia sp.]|uniref:pseudouridine synthase n=1 Tax=uncultured Sunxiuqinia sp. TaxID=1573825 RepID=UPI002AA83743|nr:pseudouridine synthase [uncultured Sunxiuqinia sp.]
MTKNSKPEGRDYSWGKDADDQSSSPQSKKISILKKSDREIRLNKFIANAGICSRRDADQLIEKGEITINGEVVTSLGHKVTTKDEVVYKGKVLSAEKNVYVLLNKPKGFVTTMDDPHAEKKVISLVKNACEERIYPVGRLDKDTTGLLLFTNDGELTTKLTHPSYEKKKIYHVFLDKEFRQADLDQVKKGIELEDGFIAADAISFVEDGDKQQVGIEIHSGKNRIVRRIFAHLGYRVVKLDRVVFAGLTKKNLPRGTWRLLTDKEVGFLKMS